MGCQRFAGKLTASSALSALSSIDVFCDKGLLLVLLLPIDLISKEIIIVVVQNALLLHTYVLHTGGPRLLG